MGVKMRKTYWILIILGVVFLPLVLNWLILQPSRFEVVGDGTHWLSFWVTWLSAFASFAMVLITWKTLKQNKEQVDDELKRQWEEQNRARLTFSIVVVEKMYMIKISNIGNINAHNILLKFNDSFVESLYSQNKRDAIKEIQDVAFSIEANTSRYIPISLCYTERMTVRNDVESFTSADVNKWLDMNIGNRIAISGTYCDKYTVEEEFSIIEFTGKGVADVKDDITMTIQNIQKGLTSPNLLTPIPTIQKSLSTLNDNMNKIIKKFEDNDTK